MPKTPFGPRYGATLRKRYAKIWQTYNSPKICPKCEKEGAVYRIKIGIWGCKKCGAKFTGAAYNIYSEIGRIVKLRTVLPVEELKKNNEATDNNVEKTVQEN